MKKKDKKLTKRQTSSVPSKEKKHIVMGRGEKKHIKARKIHLALSWMSKKMNNGKKSGQKGRESKMAAAAAAAAPIQCVKITFVRKFFQFLMSKNKNYCTKRCPYNAP